MARESPASYRRDPQAVNRTFAARFLHHPALNQFALLPGIAAVDDHFGVLHQRFDDFELLFVSRVTNQFDAEAGRNHRQRSKAPPLPAFRVVVRLLERTEVPEGPCHLVAVPLDIPVHPFGRPEHLRDFACHTGLFCYANFHPCPPLLLNCDAKVRFPDGFSETIRNYSVRIIRQYIFYT